MKSRQIAKTDDNQNEIVKVLRGLGGSWQSTHTIPGALDGIIGYKGIDQRAEIKDGNKPKSRRQLTTKEKETFASWRGRKPVVIESLDDLFSVLMTMAKGK